MPTRNKPAPVTAFSEFQTLIKRILGNQNQRQRIETATQLIRALHQRSPLFIATNPLRILIGEERAQARPIHLGQDTLLKGIVEALVTQASQLKATQ